MMIDFKSTAQSGDTIEFVNDKGQTVRTYPISELEQYVTDNNLNLSYGHEAKGGTGMVSDPNTDFTEIEVITHVSEWIDDNWISITEQFYISRNPHEFKSANREQETRKVVRG